MTDPWRYRCPEGHTVLEPRRSGGYYCRTCQTVYERVRDYKTGRSVGNYGERRGSA